METISDVETFWGFKSVDLVGGTVIVDFGDESFEAEFLGLFKDDRGDWNAVIRLNGKEIDMVHPSRILRR